MRGTRPTVHYGFSLIELVIVISIIGIVSAIAVPRFTDAAAGRRLSAAKRTLIADIEYAKLRARATSKIYVIVFYPSKNKYILAEGTDVRVGTIVFTRDFDDNPYKIGIARTNLGGQEYSVVTPFGELSPGFTVGLTDNDVEITVPFTGIPSIGITPTIDNNAGDVTVK